ncbi:Flp family type IVb pilin [Methyloceanibacter stevinii]|uniref:Flp family type IVb pilin n=1 Tax=Methyloceanibacter stevinii TaxID=1774970 RepID=UPI0009F5AAEB|nr:Flp family type IVb pilin [Methyloceanibacter stevinii]
MGTLLTTFLKNESGASAIEYGLVAAGIAVAISTSMSLVSCSLLDVFQTVSGKMTMK